MLEETPAPQDMSVSQLIQAVSRLQDEASRVEASAHDDGLIKAFASLKNSLISNLDWEDDDDQREIADNIMADFLTQIGKSHWTNPFKKITEWRVRVEMDDNVMFLDITADDAEEAEQIVRDGLKVDDKVIKYRVYFDDENNYDSFTTETDHDCDDPDDDDLLADVQITVTPAE